MKVLKFGGTSMATAQSILRVNEIIGREKEAAVVVSAPGKRYKGDVKVTDLLFDCYKAKLTEGRCDVPFKLVEERFLELSRGLGVEGLKAYLDQIRHDINSGAGIGYTVSRGEYLSALILRHLVSCEFIDAAELIKFDTGGNFDLEFSKSCIFKRLGGSSKAVIPGYYGIMPNGEIKTFSRGGCDVSGAVIAAGIDAECYENWTDVDGVYFCPLTDICKPVKKLSYRQMRELSYLGAVVLHPDSLLPLIPKGIPVVIKNTFNPFCEGTVIDAVGAGQGADVLAVAGCTGFKMVNMYSAAGTDNGYFKSVQADIEKQGAKIFTALAGVDSLTAVLSGQIPEGFNHAVLKSEDIALFTIIGGNKKEAVKKINGMDIDYKILVCDNSDSGVILGVAESELDSTLRKLCLMFYCCPIQPERK